MNIARVPPLFGQKCNHKMNFILQPNPLFARNLHWTWGVTRNPCKRRWTTTWTWMNPDCNWDDLFRVKSTSNFLQCRILSFPELHQFLEVNLLYCIIIFSFKLYKHCHHQEYTKKLSGMKVPNRLNIFDVEGTQTQNNDKVKSRGTAHVYLYTHINLYFSPLYHTLDSLLSQSPYTFCPIMYYNFTLSCFPTHADIYAAGSTEARSDFILELSRSYILCFCCQCISLCAL